MSVPSLPTLWDLTKQSILRSETLDVSDMECLPKQFFPLLLGEAFTGGHSRTVRTMVATWPYRCLPLGDLMKTPNMETFQAVLDGLDFLITQKDRPRRWKLEVLDLRNVWPGAVKIGCSHLFTDMIQTTEAHGDCGVKWPLKVVFYYHLQRKKRMDKHQECFIQWAQQRKSVLHLCCQKLQVSSVHEYDFHELLSLFEPDCIQEVSFMAFLVPKNLTIFAPVLGHMRNIQKLEFKGISKSCRDDSEDKRRDLDDMFFSRFISELPKLQNLQHLCLNHVHFLEGRLDQVLRYLTKPLETLSLHWSCLTESDWLCLSESPIVCQLKHLKMSGTGYLPWQCQLLCLLLERLRATLQTLELEVSSFNETNLCGLLAPLSHCPQLNRLSLYGAYFTTSDLKNLIQHTAGLTQLTMELYPLPLECYGEQSDVLVETSIRVCSELMDTLNAIRQTKTVRFAPYCYSCRCTCFLYDPKIRLCNCLQ